MQQINKEKGVTMRSKLLTTIFTILLTSFFSLPIKAAEIPLKEAISTLKAAEKKLKSVKWERKTIPRILLRDDDQVNKINIDNVDEFAKADHPYYVNNSVVFDLASKRFIVEESACYEWFSGQGTEASPLTYVGAYSYDGKYYYAWERSALGEEEPNADEYTDAQLSVDPSKVRNVSHFLETNGASVDFGMGFPGYLAHSGVDGVFVARTLSSTLSEWNKEGFPISINETHGGKWAIEAKVIYPMIIYEEDPSGAPRMVERIREMERILHNASTLSFSNV
jgi:hypothetical protein